MVGIVLGFGLDHANLIKLLLHITRHEMKQKYVYLPSLLH